jgi:hypothetical protein
MDIVTSSRNAHLVHQNWYRISFTSIETLKLNCCLGKAVKLKKKITKRKL